jgi:multidrug resistance efflux pump
MENLMNLPQTYRSSALVAAGLMAVLVLIASGCSRREPIALAQPAKQSQPAASVAEAVRPESVQVERPTREPIRRVANSQPAQVAPYEQTDLYAKVGGYLDSFGQVRHVDGTLRSVDIGDRVTKGQVMAVLSIPEMEQERLQKEALVEQAQAEVGQSEAAVQAVEAMIDAARAKVAEARAQIAKYDAELAYRKSEYERFVTLVKERAVSQGLEDEKLNQFRAAEAAKQAVGAALMTSQANLRVEEATLIKANADVVSAKARLKVAQANLEHTMILLNYATIKAPYDGIVTRRWSDTGAFIQSAASGKPDPLFTIVRVDRLRIIANLPESEASQVQVGLPVTFQENTSRGQSPQPLAGRVVRLAEALDSATRTMRIEIELDAPSPTLRPGMFGSISVLYTDPLGEP